MANHSLSFYLSLSSHLIITVHIRHLMRFIILLVVCVCVKEHTSHSHRPSGKHVPTKPERLSTVHRSIPISMQNSLSLGQSIVPGVHCPAEQSIVPSGINTLGRQKNPAAQSY